MSFWTETDRHIKVTQFLTIKYGGTIIQVLTKNIIRLLVRKTKFKLSLIVSERQKNYHPNIW